MGRNGEILKWSLCVYLDKSTRTGTTLCTEEELPDDFFAALKEIQPDVDDSGAWLERRLLHFLDHKDLAIDPETKTIAIPVTNQTWEPCPRTDENRCTYKLVPTKGGGSPPAKKGSPCWVKILASWEVLVTGLAFYIWLYHC